MTTDIKQLRAVCEAATQGEWRVDPNDTTYVRVGPYTVCGANLSHHDARHIATFSPATVRALLKRLERAEADYHAERQISAKRRTERDAARAEAQRLAAERDEARRECQRWSDRAESSLNDGIKEHDTLRAALARAEAERDEARNAPGRIWSEQLWRQEMADAQRAEAERIAAWLDRGGGSSNLRAGLVADIRSGAHRTEGGDRG